MNIKLQKVIKDLRLQRAKGEITSPEFREKLAYMINFFKKNP